ncbi:MAG TPA: hypothetical protein DCQ47_05960 [Gammaproteobacteria bacterium]|nr:hypothetical protein [Gammaproteobacteria bacterium]
MSDKNGNIIVTLPAWEGRKSQIGASLAHLADQYLVKVVQSPIMQLELVNDAIRRAVLRELAEWDEVKADYTVTVVCSTPEAPDALEQFDELCIALRLRGDRLKFAAIDQETAISVSEVCQIKEISNFPYTSVMIPEVPGSFKELTDLIAKREGERELCLIFEPTESPGWIAKTLIGNGLRAIRMGFYKYKPIQIANLPPADNPTWWVIVNDAAVVPEIARGLKRQNMKFSNIRWISSRPSVGSALKKILPKSEFIEVSELRSDIILERIKGHISPAL